MNKILIGMACLMLALTTMAQSATTPTMDEGARKRAMEEYKAREAEALRINEEIRKKFLDPVEWEKYLARERRAKEKLEKMKFSPALERAGRNATRSQKLEAETLIKLHNGMLKSGGNKLPPETLKGYILAEVKILKRLLPGATDEELLELLK